MKTISSIDFKNFGAAEQSAASGQEGSEAAWRKSGKTYLDMRDGIKLVIWEESAA